MSDPNSHCMTLKILLPSEVFANRTDITRLTADTRSGSYGLLPGRLDCVAVLAPGILAYSSEADGEVYVAIDEGVLVKTGRDVVVSVRGALGGTDLSKLRKAVEREFVNVDAQEKTKRLALAKMEVGFVRQFAEFERKSGN